MTPNDRPWMTAIEMQFAAMRYSHALASRHQWKSEDHREANRLIMLTLREAESFSWSTETVTAVLMAAKTLPLNTTLQLPMLPCSTGWWWFEQSVGDCVALAYHADMTHEMANIFLFSFVDGVKAPVGAAGTSFPFGATLDDFKTNPEWDTALDSSAFVSKETLGKFFLAACAWLQQRILTCSPGHIERHRRKQIARDSNIPLPSDVKVVQLRRIEPQAHGSVSENESVDWSCRWIVGGHFRNQHVREGRKLIFINPHIKGPADKPLKVPTHTVYAVNR